MGGSSTGHGLGPLGLRAGAILGGVIGVVLATTIARRRKWVHSREYVAATAGGIAGFLVAAFVAVNTMSSPVGPVGSTLLIGVGALAGVACAAGRTASADARRRSTTQLR